MTVRLDNDISYGPGMSSAVSQGAKVSAEIINVRDEFGSLEWLSAFYI